MLSLSPAGKGTSSWSTAQSSDRLSRLPREHRLAQLGEILPTEDLGVEGSAHFQRHGALWCDEYTRPRTLPRTWLLIIRAASVYPPFECSMTHGCPTGQVLGSVALDSKLLLDQRISSRTLPGHRASKRPCSSRMALSARSIPSSRYLDSKSRGCYDRPWPSSGCLNNGRGKRMPCSEREQPSQL